MFIGNQNWQLPKSQSFPTSKITIDDQGYNSIKKQEDDERMMGQY